MKVAIPSTPADAKGLLAAAIRDPDPVIVLEPKLHYRTMRGEVPAGEHVVPLGEARVARSGDDATIVAYGSMVPVAEAAADALEGEASIEVLDIRTLKPLDEDALLAAAGKTGRVVIVQEAPRTAGYGAELAAILAEKAMLDLRAPVIRVTGDRGRVHAVRRAGRRGGPQDARVLIGERLRLWLERGGAGYYLRDAATGEPVRWEDPRLRVVPIAGVTFRPGNVDDASFDPGRRLALVREPENEHDPNAVAIWNEDRTLQAGYVPRETAAELAGDEQAVSLWRVEGGLRVLIVPPDAWVGRPR